MTAQDHAPTKEARFALRSKNRARAWEWIVKGFKPGASVWRLEWIKAAVSLAEDRLDFLPSPSEKNKPVVSSCRIALGIVLGCIIAVVYILRQRCGAKQGKLSHDTTRFAAIHAEWSTRTRHLLTAIDSAESSVGAVILMGRMQRSPAQTVDLWESKQGRGSRAASLPLILPMSPRACLAALSDLPALIREGGRSSQYMPLPLPLREQIAITFRVVLGAVAARWWQEIGAAESEVFFAITGTADTTLLERAIHQKGGRTVHVLHGQATGPNFVGISNLALFRSKYDAEAYSRIGCYCRCDVQPAPLPNTQRGKTGLLLLSNLAHPMNPDFRRQPLQDEFALLTCAANAARQLGLAACPLMWKPHPVIAELPKEMQAKLRTAARKEGFIELPSDTDPVSAAAACRWVLTSPSTVAIDLLQAGYLSVVLDPQGSVLDTALTGLPQSPVEPEPLVELLEKLNGHDAYASAFADAFDVIGPARLFDLKLDFPRNE